MRRRFDHLVAAISLAVGQPIARYRLWLRLHEAGIDPEGLTAPLAVAFCDGALTGFLADEGLELRRRARRRLRKQLLGFDPDSPNPDDGLIEFAE